MSVGVMKNSVTIKVTWMCRNQKLTKNQLCCETDIFLNTLAYENAPVKSALVVGIILIHCHYIVKDV